MKECIEREALFKRINTGMNIIEAMQAIMDCSTADVRENVRGEWVEDDYGYIHCSHCGMEWDEPEHPKTNYCPNCGCFMEVDE